MTIDFGLVAACSRYDTGVRMASVESPILPPELRVVKTMLSAHELDLLHTLARDRYTGRGEIVDGGAFLGGSTLALATGLRDNPNVVNKRRRIHSYDLFISDRFVSEHIQGYPEGCSTRPYYDSVIANVSEHVAVREGDITTFPWPMDMPIEILFIDVSKTWEINDFLLEHFFPRLIPGVSTVIQQDYHWPHMPWLSITMELLRDHVTYLGSMPWATSYYRWERPLVPGEVPARLKDLGIDRLRELASRAQVFERGGREWAAQQCNLVSLCLWFGEVTAAQEIHHDTVAAAAKWVDYFQFKPDFSTNA